MKRSSILIAISALIHLLVIDLTFYLISSGTSNILFPLGIYNLIWLWITGTVISHSYNADRGN